MKLEANVEFVNSANCYKVGDVVHVDVDIDYVEDDADSVAEWVRNELEEMHNCQFSIEDFRITNMEDIVTEIKFDEYLDKTSYSEF